MFILSPHFPLYYGSFSGIMDKFTVELNDEHDCKLATSNKHINGTERIAEVAKKFRAKLIVDIQGDEPLVDPSDIDKVINFHLISFNRYK